jgi:hypothetical protein
MHFSPPVILNFIQCCPDLLQLPLVERIFKTASLLVFLLELFELLLFLFQLREPGVNIIDEFIDFVTFCVGLGHDAQGLRPTLLVDFGTRHFLQESQPFMIFGVREGGNLAENHEFG